MMKFSVLLCNLFFAISLFASNPIDLSSYKKDSKGWIKIFDGKTFAGWRGYNKVDVPKSWTVDNGTLHVASAGGRPSKETGGDLLFDYKFKDFEFEYEWKVGKGANSGVFI